jgi:hypothetical protein
MDEKFVITESLKELGRTWICNDPTCHCCNGTVDPDRNSRYASVHWRLAKDSLPKVGTTCLVVLRGRVQGDDGIWRPTGTLNIHERIVEFMMLSEEPIFKDAFNPYAIDCDYYHLDEVAYWTPLEDLMFREG